MGRVSGSPAADDVGEEHGGNIAVVSSVDILGGLSVEDHTIAHIHIARAVETSIVLVRTVDGVTVLSNTNGQHRLLVNGSVSSSVPGGVLGAEFVTFLTELSLGLESDVVEARRVHVVSIGVMVRDSS